MRAPGPYRRQLALGRNDPRANTRRRHGLLPIELEAMLRSQGGGCLLCGRPLTIETLFVDHDHALALAHGHAVETGCRRCVRGLICPTDNTVLGAVRDNPGLLRKMADYVERSRAR